MGGVSTNATALVLPFRARAGAAASPRRLATKGSLSRRRVMARPAGPLTPGDSTHILGWVAGPVFEEIVEYNLWSRLTIFGNGPAGGSYK